LLQKQNLQYPSRQFAESRQKPNVWTSQQNSAASSASNSLAVLQKIHTEQLTEPGRAADCPDKAGSCTARVPASTASESEHEYKQNIINNFEQMSIEL